VNSRSWFFWADSGKQYKLGLMHGPNSGHVLVYCNKKILLIDFKVLQSKKYTFFIEDDLCELKIDRIDNSFEYNFILNKQIDTPKNVANRKTQKQNFISNTIFLSLFIIMIFGAVYFLTSNHQQLKSQLDTSGIERKAKVFIDPGDKKARYYYVFNANRYDGSIKLESTTIPLEDGGEATVLLLPHHPEINKLIRSEK